MAEKVYCTKSKITAIADAIRTKGGTGAYLTLDSMPAAVAAIPSGGDIDGVVDGSFSGAYDGRVTNIGKYKFSNCEGLTAVRITPKTNALMIGEYAFLNCTGMTSFEIVGDVDVTINGYAFQRCSGLTELAIPVFETAYNSFANCTNLEVFRGTRHRPSGYTGVPSFTSPFYSCRKLRVVDIDMAMDFGGSAVHWVSPVLDTIVIRDTEVMATMSVSNLFGNCTHFTSGGNGKIYVPDALVDQYKAATNWAAYASMIHPLSEYVESA